MSKIEWTEKTWNPITGCTPISPGCLNCYAKKMALRIQAMGVKKYRNGFDVTCHINSVEPFARKKPTKYFVGSMTDIFHDDVPRDFLESIFSEMAILDRHIFIILTKRPERMHQLFNDEDFQESVTYIEGETDTGVDGYGYLPWPLPNVWLCVTAENQEFADKRVPLLLDTPAAVRGLSIEPMLSAVHLWPIDGVIYDGGMPVPWQKFDKPGIDWVVCGCESGPKARPMNEQWAVDLKNECVDAGISFFLKQMKIDGKLTKMPPLNGRVWDQMPT